MQLARSNIVTRNWISVALGTPKPEMCALDKRVLKLTLDNRLRR